MAETDDHSAFEADFSDYYERTLAEPRRKEVERHLAECARCKDEYDRFRGAIGALSGLHKVNAPPKFEQELERTIHRRSAGRFFGRRAFGDRVPFSILAVIGLVIVTAVFVLMYVSATGSVHEPLKKSQPAPRSDQVRQVVPVP